jgi:hypothetical protein
MQRRFANRQPQQLIDAIEEARPDAAPALAALYRVTANVLRLGPSRAVHRTRPPEPRLPGYGARLAGPGMTTKAPCSHARGHLRSPD